MDPFLTCIHVILIRNGPDPSALNQRHDETPVFSTEMNFLHGSIKIKRNSKLWNSATKSVGNMNTWSIRIKTFSICSFFPPNLYALSGSCLLQIFIFITKSIMKTNKTSEIAIKNIVPDLKGIKKWLYTRHALCGREVWSRLEWSRCFRRGFPLKVGFSQSSSTQKSNSYMKRLWKK